MLINRILGVLGGQGGKVPEPKSANPAPPQTEIDTRPEDVVEGRWEVPVYPERGRPAPAVPPKLLLKSQSKLIDALHQASACSRAEFDAYLMPAIERYAEYVHLLPASETQHHCGQGGLLRHGLEVAYNAAMGSEGKVFAFDHWASERDRLVPRWRVCAILGGLTHDMGKPLVDVGAVDASGRLLWNPHTGPLYRWLTEHGLKEYYIYWRPGARHKRHEAFTTLALYRIVPEETWRWLADCEGGQEPIDAMVMALAGSSSPSNPLVSIIRQADSNSVSRDIRESRQRMAASGMGGANSLAIRLIRAMHDLIQEGTWEINKPGSSPIWVTTEGVFGITEEVIKGAVNALREQGETSLPQDYRETLNLLDDWGFIFPNVQPNGQQFLTWEVRIYAQDRGKPVEFNAHMVRFSKEDLLPKAMIPPEPVKAVILGRDGQPIGAGGRIEGAQAQPLEEPQAGHLPSRGAIEAAAEAEQEGDRPGSLADMPITPALRSRGDEYDGSMQLLGEDFAEGMLLASGTDASVASESEELPPIRNRAEEPDPRDQLMREAREQVMKRWPPEGPEEAAAFFRSNGTEGQVVLALANRVVSGDLVEGRDLWEIHGRVHFRYPQAFSGLGFDEAELRDMLESKGWTERDTNTPSRSTVMLHLDGGRKAVTLRFTENITPAILMLLPARDGKELSRPNQAVSRRKLPLGPYIDADIADMLLDLVAPNPKDSALIRPSFHRFVMDQLAPQERGPEDLSHEDIQTLVRQFTRAHRVPSTKWVGFHILRGDNPWAVKTGATRNNPQLAYNPDYRLDQDLADIDARKSS